MNNRNILKNKEKKLKLTTLGFTFVELIAVIVLLALISIVAVPLIDKVIKEGRKELFDTQISNIKKSLENWGAANVFALPNDGEEITLTFGQLKRLGYIKNDIKNPNTKMPFPNDMALKIVNNAGSYSYDVLLDTGGTNADTDVDENAPILILNGDIRTNVEVNTPYNELGVTAMTKDGVIIDDEDVEVLLLNGEQTIDTSVIGNRYEIEYKVTDNDMTNSIIRNVFVNDTIAPVLTAPGNVAINLEDIGSFDLLNGVSAIDNSGLTPVITVQGRLSAIPGKYLINYVATDSSNNTTTFTRIITCVGDEPVVEIAVVGTPFNEYGWSKTNLNLSINVIDSRDSAKGFRYCTTTSSICTPVTNVSLPNSTVAIMTEGSSNRICVIGYNLYNDESELTCSDIYRIDRTGPSITGNDDLRVMFGNQVNLVKGMIIDDSISGVSNIVANPASVPGDVLGTTVVTYTATDRAGNTTVKTRKIIVTSPCEYAIGRTWNFTYSGSMQFLEIPDNCLGNYKVELWGASGGRLDVYASTENGGKGSYTSGNIHINTSDKLFIQIGGQGQNLDTPGSIVGYTTYSGYASVPGGYNGGGNGIDEADGSSHSGNESGAPGGGATDIRTVSDELNSELSINSRIMVAAGGSGAYNLNGTAYAGRPGGGLSSTHPDSLYMATQTFGNAFGKGMDGIYFTHAGDWGTSGAGGGYYGGLNYLHPTDASGIYSVSSGGSSYISGHTGCVAITGFEDRNPKSGCTTGTFDNDCSTHYTGLKFTNTVMIDGAGYTWSNIKNNKRAMPRPDGGYYPLGTGHTGHGYARITYMGE